MKGQPRKRSSKRGHDRPSLDEIEKVLRSSTKLLNHAALLVRDSDLEPEKNIHRIGEALVLVFEIEKEIYARRPDLMPTHLKRGTT